MRCQKCDYELWHSTSRTCTECGTEFSLRDYVFEKDIVLFHCPHCNWGIKGEPPKGLPLVSIRHCESCNEPVGLDSYIVRPIEEHGAHSFGTLLPIHLKHGNRFTRYFETVWLVMTKPQSAISRVPVQEPLWNAWKFYLFTVLITLVVGIIPITFFFILSVFGSIPSDSTTIAEILMFTWVQLAMAFIFIMLYTMVWLLVTHVLLLVSGGSAHTIRRTTQAILYGGGATITGVVPCVGGLLSSIWWLVATTNMVIKGQRVSGGRGMFATITGPVLLFIFVCGGYFMLMFAVLTPAFANARVNAKLVQAQQQQQQQQQQQIQMILVEDADTQKEEITDQQSE